MRKQTIGNRRGELSVKDDRGPCGLIDGHEGMHVSCGRTGRMLRLMRTSIL